MISHQMILPAFVSEHRRGQCRKWNCDRNHQVMAGRASFAAFSARFRACQGLMPLDVDHTRKYVRPSDIRFLGVSLPPGLSVVVWYFWCAGVPVDVAGMLGKLTALRAEDSAILDVVGCRDAR